jgi:CheY-like chemotaxis protein
MFSRITRGMVQLRKERLDLTGIVAGAAETVRPKVDAVGHHLTVSPPPASPAAQPKAEEVKPGANGPCKVLVVDDNIDAAMSLAMLLRIWGHQVRTADDGPAALDAAAEFQPDAVLLDIGLPGMDGYEVAQRLRQQPSTMQVLLIAVTGYGQDADRRRSREAGFDHHLVKPVDPETLRPLLRSGMAH